MILSGHQPVYLPGILFFNKLALSDLFMYVGHVQFSPKSWQQRNRIALNGQEYLLSVPVIKAGLLGQKIDEVQISEEPWRRKHLGSIRQAYSKSPFFKFYFQELEDVLSYNYDSLGLLNRAVISLMSNWLKIDTPVVESYDYPNISGSKTNMLIEMCQAVGADQYLSNEGARIYVDETKMALNGIQHIWQKFIHPEYSHCGTFLKNMSALDILFNLGPDAGSVVRGCGDIFVTPT